MRVGGGAPKGAEFERYCCKRLSLFITKGWRDDCMWRTAASGGRATFQLRNDIINRAQAGDITAIASEAITLSEQYLFECKSYKNLQYPQMLTKGSGLLAGFYRDTQRVAERLGKLPILVAKQNFIPPVILCPPECDVFTRGRLSPLLDKLQVQVYLFDEATAMIRRRKVA